MKKYFFSLVLLFGLMAFTEYEPPPDSQDLQEIVSIDHQQPFVDFTLAPCNVTAPQRPIHNGARLEALHKQFNPVEDRKRYQFSVFSCNGEKQAMTLQPLFFANVQSNNCISRPTIRADDQV